MTAHPKLLLDWTNITEWRDVIIDAALAEFAPARDRAWLLSHRPETTCWDDFRWYEPLRKTAGIEGSHELMSRLGGRLPHLFERLRAVHLCRPIDAETYRRRGLLRLNPVERQNDLLQFLKSQHPELADNHFQRAIARTNLNDERRKDVYFGIDERSLLGSKNTRHYAEFGSEYQWVLAGELGPRYRETLRRRGRPAYVVIHLPFTLLSDDHLWGLAADLLPAAISSYGFGPEKRITTSSGWHIGMDIPPEMVHDIVYVPERESDEAT